MSSTNRQGLSVRGGIVVHVATHTRQIPHYLYIALID